MDLLYLPIPFPDKTGRPLYMNVSITRENVAGFVWQHLWLLFSLFVMTLGVALCVRSMLGSSVISSVPYVMENAGKYSSVVPALTIGQYTYIMNFVLVLGQMLVLGRKFEKVQLFQLVIGFAFGMLIDFSMVLTDWVQPSELPGKAFVQLLGCTVMGVGIALEVRCGSVTMPGEGLPVAISRVTGMEFAKVKIMVDITLVVAAVVLCYVFFGSWQWHIVGPGTLLAMVYVGVVVRFTGRHLAPFDRMLGYRPGFRRYIYGLARFLRRRTD